MGIRRGGRQPEDAANRNALFDLIEHVGEAEEAGGRWAAAATLIVRCARSASPRQRRRMDRRLASAGLPLTLGTMSPARQANVTPSAPA